MTGDPGCTQKESLLLSCALSAAASSDSLPPGGHSAPCQPRVRGSERALTALSAPHSRRAARPPRWGRRVLAWPPLSPPAERLCGSGCCSLPVLPPPRPRTASPLCLPFPRAPAAPHTPPHRRTERTAPTTAAAARRSPTRPCNLQATASQLFPTSSRPPATAAAAATAAPSEPATHSKPQKQTEPPKGALPPARPPPPLQAPPPSRSGD